jgi:methyl-accepting chemotaxis protein
MVDGAYRYSLPIVLGVTEGAKAEVCFGCHGAMGLQSGDVIAVLSSSLSVGPEWRVLSVILAFMAIAGAAATVIAVFGVNMILGNVVVRPINVMTGWMNQLVDGDCSVEVGFQDRSDEMGDMARALEVFKERSSALQSMADHFDATVKSKVRMVAEATGGIRTTAQAMVMRSERTGGHSLEVGEAARIANARSQAVAQATLGLTESINEIAGQSSQSSTIARTAVEKVDGVSMRLDDLGGSVRSIGAIVGVISGIATKTNRLALNASLEAARAGEAGRGFAVVAEQVQILAAQTAKATEDIARQVTEIQNFTNSMTGSFIDVARIIRAMDHASHVIASAVHQQEAAAREISGHINEVAHQTDLVSHTVGALTHASCMACAGTVRVIWSARSLQKGVEELGEEADQFLKSVRNADGGSNTMELF